MSLIPMVAGAVTASAAWLLTGPYGALDPLSAEVTALVLAVGAVVTTLSLASVAE